jgi:hypothetical protein
LDQVGQQFFYDWNTGKALFVGDTRQLQEGLQKQWTNRPTGGGCSGFDAIEQQRFARINAQRQGCRSN